MFWVKIIILLNRNDIKYITDKQINNFDKYGINKPDLSSILRSENYQNLLYKIITEIKYEITKINRDIMYDDSDTV